jgi:subtilase family serine protease
MCPQHTSIAASSPNLDPQSWIRRGDMTDSLRKVARPMSRPFSLRSPWRRSRRLRAARRGCWIAAVIVPAALVACGSSGPAGATASQTTPRTSQPAPSTGMITFYLGLPTHADSLVNDALADAMPGDAHYRHFWSVASLAAKYGASSGTMRQVAQDVKTFGLSVAIDPSRLFARVSGTAGQWTSALKAPLGEQPATQNNPFVTYSLPNHLPAGLPPSGTTWLSSDANVYDPSADGHRPSTGLTRAGSTDATINPAAEPWPKNTGTVGLGTCNNQNAVTSGEVYTPSQVQTAYGVTGLAAAAGSATPSIDIIDLGGGWNPSDLQAAGACFGYGSVHVSQSQGDGVPTPIDNTDPETSLDLQTTAAVAPKAAIHLIQTSDGPAALLDGFSRALADPHGTPDVITLSYGGCGVADALTASTFVTITNEVLAMIAMTGTSTFIAAGDDGSTTCPGPGLFPTLSFPAVSPVVTAVGGTRLTLNAQNHRASEVVWNDAQYGEVAAGGGGLALATARPPYQKGFNSSSTRAVPDVSALADIVPGWPVFVDGQLEPVGGTSGSAPFTAAATALVDAQQRSHHEPRIGLANGWLYQAAQRNHASFYDVTQGNNRLKLLNCCKATSGYDMASGLGVPNWAVLPSELTHPAA